MPYYKGFELISDTDFSGQPMVYINDHDEAVMTVRSVKEAHREIDKMLRKKAEGNPMPQASAELRAEWGIDDAAAWEFLKGHGWTEKHFVLVPPVLRTIDAKEWRAAQFLRDEWDWETER